METPMASSTWDGTRDFEEHADPDVYKRQTDDIPPLHDVEQKQEIPSDIPQEDDTLDFEAAVSEFESKILAKYYACLLYTSHGQCCQTGTGRNEEW